MYKILYTFLYSCEENQARSQPENCTHESRKEENFNCNVVK